MEFDLTPLIPWTGSSGANQAIDGYKPGEGISATATVPNLSRQCLAERVTPPKRRDLGTGRDAREPKEKPRLDSQTGICFPDSRTRTKTLYHYNEDRTTANTWLCFWILSPLPREIGCFIGGEGVVLGTKIGFLILFWDEEPLTIGFDWVRRGQFADFKMMSKEFNWQKFFPLTVHVDLKYRTNLDALILIVYYLKILSSNYNKY